MKTNVNGVIDGKEVKMLFLKCFEAFNGFVDGDVYIAILVEPIDSIYRFEFNGIFMKERYIEEFFNRVSYIEFYKNKWSQYEEECEKYIEEERIINGLVE